VFVDKTGRTVKGLPVTNAVFTVTYATTNAQTVTGVQSQLVNTAVQPATLASSLASNSTSDRAYSDAGDAAGSNNVAATSQSDRLYADIASSNAAEVARIAATNQAAQAAAARYLPLTGTAAVATVALSGWPAPVAQTTQVYIAQAGTAQVAVAALALAPGAASNLLASAAAHTNRTDNPHAVTAAQVGAVPTNDPRYLAALTNAADFDVAGAAAAVTNGLPSGTNLTGSVFANGRLTALGSAFTGAGTSAVQTIITPYSNPAITTIGSLATNGTVTLNPNVPQLLAMATTNVNYAIAFGTNGAVAGRYNWVMVQIETTTGCTVTWPTNTVMNWISGSVPTLRSGTNWLYWDRMRDADIWQGVAQ
jgi:hypothetical protein